MSRGLNKDSEQIRNTHRVKSAQVGRILVVTMQRRTYFSLAYVLLRLPLFVGFLAIWAFLFRAIGAFLFRASPLTLWTPLLIVVTAFAVWGVVITERAVVRHWYGSVS